MPAMELINRHQRAQLWRKVGVDEYNNTRVSAREELVVRWENKRIQTLDPKGQPIDIDAIVHSTCTIEDGSIMWEGCADDLPEDTSNIDNLMEVVAFNHTPDIKGRVIRKTYALKRYTNRLPTIV